MTAAIAKNRTANPSPVHEHASERSSLALVAINNALLLLGIIGGLHPFEIDFVKIMLDPHLC
jgi:hypothetical protein